MPEHVPTVIHYTGHRVSGAELRTPFAADQEPRIAREIAAALDEIPVVAAFGSLAAGADLLVAEAMAAGRIALHLVFPFDVGTFRSLSVRPSGPNWLERFDRLLPRAQSVKILNGRPDCAVAYRRCTLHAMALALRCTMRLHAAALQLAVWDGAAATGPAGTSADVALWRGRGLPTRVIAAG
jgi:hypothetical protein